MAKNTSFLRSHNNLPVRKHYYMMEVEREERSLGYYRIRPPAVGIPFSLHGYYLDSRDYC